MATNTAMRLSNSPVEALLRELINEVRGLRFDIAESGAGQKRFSEEDDLRDLAVIAQYSAGHVFTSDDLRAHARLHPELQRTTRQLGKRLQALAGRNLGGMVLVRVKRDQAGTLWAVLQVPDNLHTGDGAFTDRGV